MRSPGSGASLEGRIMTRNVVITGATSGIGAALALRYAAPGIVLGLIGRNVERLRRIADDARQRGAIVVTGRVDVRDRATMQSWLHDFDRDHPIDLVVANAGVMEGTPPGCAIEPPDAAYDLMQTNVLGAMNTIQPVLDGMMKRARGQIAIVSSIAAFIPLADSPSYCASKSAVLSYGLSLRALLVARGIRVNVICPGYIETPMMGRENGPKPFKVSAERAADLIAAGLDRDKAVISFPVFFAWVTWLNGILPDGLRRRLSRSFRFTVSHRD
ncbi:MAG: SDR family NAD(P)-dependent oxidoreductase [Bradyrhizobium sp.]|nr:SDR family NAD(P)-dependent oxidoreductase [Bradyrhizobium sp.]